MIVCIGDSLTAGQYLPHHEDKCNYPAKRCTCFMPQMPWPMLLDYDVFNAGVNGDTTRLGLERFPRDVQERRPAAVVIQFGHNDCNTWQSDAGLHRVSSTAYGANLWEMVDRARTFKAIPILCSLIPVIGRSSGYTAAVEWYNSILRGIAASSKTTLADVRSAFGDRTDLHLPDGIHLNAEGHRVYAAVVQDALDEVFR